MQTNLEIHSFETNTLSAEEYARIVEAIRNLYLWFAPGSTDEDIYQRLHRHPKTRIDLIGAEGMQDIGGFSVYHTEHINGRKIMFRGGTIIGDRSKGLYREVLRHGVSLEKPEFLVAMTQNPRVYETMRSMSQCGLAYPSVEDSPIPDHVKEVAVHFGSNLNMNPKTLIVPDVYHSIRKDTSFKTTRDSKVQAMFTDRIGKNDGFLVVVPL